MWVRNGMTLSLPTLGTKWYDLGTKCLWYGNLWPWVRKWYGTRAHGYEMT